MCKTTHFASPDGTQKTPRRLPGCLQEAPPVQVLACLLVRFPAIRGLKHNSPGYPAPTLCFSHCSCVCSPKRKCLENCCKNTHFSCPDGTQMAPRRPPGRLPGGRRHLVTSACLLACSIASTLLLPLRSRSGNVCFPAEK